MTGFTCPHCGAANQTCEPGSLHRCLRCSREIRIVPAWEMSGRAARRLFSRERRRRERVLRDCGVYRTL